MKLLLIASAITACLGKPGPKRDPIDIGSLGVTPHTNDRSQGQVLPFAKEGSQGEWSSLACGSVDTLGYGEYVMLETPNYPWRYPNNADCEWELEFPAGAALSLSCEDFSVKRGDFLTIGDLQYYGYSTGFQGMPIELEETAASLSLSFTSNRRKRSWGFRCYVEVEEGDLSTTTSPEPPTLAPGNCTCGLANFNEHEHNRIVGGEETEQHEYPWQVALVHAQGSHPFCGGTLISPQHVLSAAHCLEFWWSTPDNVAVLLGEHRIDDSSFTRVSLSAITNHPDYDFPDLDFSILTLSEPVTFTKTVSPACLPGDVSATFQGVPATVSGWGATSWRGNQPTTLKEAQVTVLSQEECLQYWTSSTITSNMICAFDTDHLDKGVCNGDSGGPLIVQDPVSERFAVAGVTSFGYEGCSHGVFARVTAQMDWILANTEGTQSTNHC